MPSPADNSPCVVYECIEAGIPFISTRGSGADELVNQDSRDDVMVYPNVKSLADKLAYILEHGARLGRPRLDLSQNLAAWSAWHGYIAQNFTTLLQTPSAVLPEPKRARIENAKASLIVIIDSGTCTISLLIENLSTQMKRFGKHAAYLILSARRGKLNEILYEIFNCNSENEQIVAPCAGQCVVVRQATLPLPQKRKRTSAARRAHRPDHLSQP
jgi:hypothetical protein